MSYNTRVNLESDLGTENEWKFRFDKVVDVIKRYDPDIIGIQEPNKSEIEDIKNLFKDTYNIVYEVVNPKAYVDTVTYESEQHREGHAIMYRKDRIELIGDIGKFWLAENPNEFPQKPQWDGSAFARMAVHAKFRDKLTDKIFYIFNTHFDHIGVLARVESANLMMDKAIEISKGLPVFLMGDFNTFCKDGGPEIRQAFQSYEAYNIFDVRKAAKQVYGKNNTWIGWPDNPWNEEKIKQRYPEETLNGADQCRYDHIFLRVTDTIDVTRTGVADDQWKVKWNGDEMKVYPSDHRPIIADVLL